MTPPVISWALPRRSMLALGLFLLGACLQAFVVGAAEPPATTQPPWSQTQERRPKEVDDKANEIPLASCDTSDPVSGESRFEANYVDLSTGTQTTIRRIEIPERAPLGRSQGAIITLGTQRWQGPAPEQDKKPIPARVVWEITIKEPGKPKKKITYEVDRETGEGTRTERSGKNKPDTRAVTGDDLVTPPKPAPATDSLLPAPFSSRALTRIAQPGPGDRPRSAPLSGGRIIAALAPATAQAPTWPSSSPGGLKTAMKAVTFGNPPRQTLAFLDPGPPLTADEYVLSEAIDTLDYEWYTGDGPAVFRPGEYFHTGEGQHIDIVGDWSLAAVPGGYLLSCHGFDFDDEEDDGGWSARYLVKFEAAEPLLK